MKKEETLEESLRDPNEVFKIIKDLGRPKADDDSAHTNFLSQGKDAISKRYGDDIAE
jgi:hypothetical protein